MNIPIAIVTATALTLDQFWGHPGPHIHSRDYSHVSELNRAGNNNNVMEFDFWTPPSNNSTTPIF